MQTRYNDDKRNKIYSNMREGILTMQRIEYENVERNRFFISVFYAGIESSCLGPSSFLILIIIRR